jgi:hypothetical protein
MAGSTPVGPDSRHAPFRAFGGRQVLAHDLGAQQHQRPGRQPGPTEKPRNLIRR